LEFSVADYAILDAVIEESKSRLIFFDEIQAAAHWELYVRQKLDQGFQAAVCVSCFKCGITDFSQ
jgi:ATPase (fragment)